MSARPTADQFEAALALAESEGIGLERALLLQQHDQIAATQARQSVQRGIDVQIRFVETFTPIIRALGDVVNDLVKSPAWPQLVAIAETEQKRKRRVANRARWQALRRA